ncbi:MAG: hypothetical protein CMF50_06275 [Legionellales bacterium]|nr:hypothetical protein [Legionellales bacterium]|tara:strand:+ start:9112 stop:10026 length:915 start_codon:yes stop_codon:yes gene_type:complete
MTYPLNKETIERNFKTLTGHSCEYRDGAIYFATEHMFSQLTEMLLENKRRALWFMGDTENHGGQKLTDIDCAKKRHLESQKKIANILPHLYTVDVSRPEESQCDDDKFTVTSIIKDPYLIKLLNRGASNLTDLKTRHGIYYAMVVIKQFLRSRIESRLQESLMGVGLDEFYKVINKDCPYNVAQLVSSLDIYLFEDDRLEFEIDLHLINSVLKHLGSACEAEKFVSGDDIRIEESGGYAIESKLMINRAKFLEELARQAKAAAQERHNFFVTWGAVVGSDNPADDVSLRALPVELVKHIGSFVR